MPTVCQIVEGVKQPCGGYLPPAIFQDVMIENDGPYIRPEEENIHPSLIGLTVDYLTRFMLGNSPEEAFSISLSGFQWWKFNKEKKTGKRLSKRKDVADKLVKQIKGLDDKSIIAGCKLVCYDIWARLPVPQDYPDPEPDNVSPNQITICHIRHMVNRTLHFFELCGGVKKVRFDFMVENKQGQTIMGDGDFLTTDTMWDLKVTRKPFTPKNTLQILIYWILGRETNEEEFKGITQIGLFNPRRNMANILDLTALPQYKSIITEVKKEVLFLE